ncbi:MAG: TlpA disulfide reductase family protein [Segetibacter sp.]
MKLLLIPAFVFISTVAFSQQEKAFVINGNLNGKFEPVQKVYLSYRANGATVIDSSQLKDGKYSFAGKVVEPVRAQLLARPSSVKEMSTWRARRKDVASIIVSPGKIEASSVDSFSNITLKGSPANDELAKIEKEMKVINQKGEELNKQYMDFDNAKDEAGKNRIMAGFKNLDKESKSIFRNYLKANPSSPIAMIVMNQYAGYDINADEVDPLFAALPASVKNYPSYKEFSDRLAVARKIGVGRQAIDFTQNDTLGKPVSLSSFKGKYVLVDFWASWCGPCRKENPNVVTAFNKYKDKGFTVLGVSLDQPNAQERWIKAIHDDGLAWTHVSDLKYWNNEAAQLYGVRSIPFNLLLDKEGKIVAKNIRGEELQTRLAEIFQ